ncbi:MAG: hypothetical protein QXG05_08590 [Nitrososphaerota archaeon]
MSENNPAKKARLPELSSACWAGVAGIAKELQIGPATLIKLLADMEEQGLIKVRTLHTKAVGRPVKQIEATELGKEYLCLFKMLQLKALKSKRQILLRRLTTLSMQKES